MDRRRMMCGADCFGDGRPHVGSAIVRVEVFNTGHASQKNAFFLDKPIEYLVRFGGDCEFPGVESETALNRIFDCVGRQSGQAFAFDRDSIQNLWG